MRLVEEVDASWPAALFVTVHVGRRRSVLPQLLQGRCAMPVSHAKDGMPIIPGQIYLAPPDHHLHVRESDMRLSHGPRVNWSRPAIDPMFISAASSHGSSVIGVIMTGLLRDGATGLFEVHRLGGQTIVQDPADARADAMPRNALRITPADHIVPLEHVSFTIAMCLRKWGQCQSEKG